MMVVLSAHVQHVGATFGGQRSVVDLECGCGRKNGSGHNEGGGE
jgi:hypothetical protein